MLRKSCFHKFTSFNKWTFRNKIWVDLRKGCKGQGCGRRLARSCGIFSINLNWYVEDQIVIIYICFKYFTNRMIAMNQKMRLKGLKSTCDWLWMTKQIFPNIWQPGYFIILWNEILNVCALIRVIQQSNLAVTVVKFLIS